MAEHANRRFRLSGYTFGEALQRFTERRFLRCFVAFGEVVAISETMLPIGFVFVVNHEFLPVGFIPEYNSEVRCAGLLGEWGGGDDVGSINQVPAMRCCSGRRSEWNTVFAEH